MIGLTPSPPLTEQARDMDGLWNVFLIGAAVVGLLVIVLVVRVVTRARGRTTLPHQQHENVPLEILYTAVPFVAVCALFAATWVVLDRVEHVGAAGDADLVIEVVGFQWQWQFVYPDGVVETGTDDVNPVLALPADTTVRFELTSIDVIHSFWIPGFRYKRDMFPGETSAFQVDIGDTTGSWPDTGVCAEFCGLDHTTMRFDVAVMSAGDFDTWLEEHRT